MLNEAKHLEGFVADLAEQDFDGHIEVLVADGGSVDGSAEQLINLANSRGLDLTVFENTRRYVAPGLNACIGRATGELIIRMDCHSRYPSDYVRRCAEASDQT